MGIAPTLACVSVALVSAAYSLFRLLLPLHPSFSPEAHSHSRKTGSLKSAQRFLLALALTDIVAPLLLLLGPLRVTTSPTQLLRVLLISAPMAPRPAMLATLALLNLLSIARGRPLRLGQFDAAIWAPAISLTLLIIGLTIAVAPPRLNPSVSYAVLALLLSAAALLGSVVFARLLLAVLRVSLGSKGTPATTSGKSTAKKQRSSDEPTRNQNNQNHSNAHTRIQEDPRPSISSYLSSLTTTSTEDGKAAVGFISAAMLGIQGARPLLNLPKFRNSEPHEESPQEPKPGTKESQRQRLSSNDSRAATIRLGGCFCSSLLSWGLGLPFLIQSSVNATSTNHPSLESPALLLILAVTLPAILLAVQIMLAEGVSPRIRKTVSPPVIREPAYHSHQSDRLSPPSTRAGARSPSLYSMNSASSFPYLHRSPTASPVPRSASTPSMRRSTDLLVTNSHANSRRSGRWSRTLSMAAFHPKLHLLPGEFTEQEQSGNSYPDENENENDNDHFSFVNATSLFSRNKKKQWDAESGPYFTQSKSSRKRKNEDNVPSTARNSSVLDYTIDFLSYQILPKLVPSVKIGRGNSVLADDSLHITLDETRRQSLPSQSSKQTREGFKNVPGGFSKKNCNGNKSVRKSLPAALKLNESSFSACKEVAPGSNKNVFQRNTDHGWTRLDRRHEKNIHRTTSEFGKKETVSGSASSVIPLHEISDRDSHIRRRSLNSSHDYSPPFNVSWINAAEAVISSDRNSECDMSSIKRDNTLSIRNNSNEDLGKESFQSKRKSRNNYDISLGVASGWLSPPIEEEEEEKSQTSYQSNVSTSPLRSSGKYANRPGDEATDEQEILEQSFRKSRLMRDFCTESPYTEFTSRRMDLAEVDDKSIRSQSSEDTGASNGSPESLKSSSGGRTEEPVVHLARRVSRSSKNVLTSPPLSAATSSATEETVSPNNIESAAAGNIGSNRMSPVLPPSLASPVLVARSDIALHFSQMQDQVLTIEEPRSSASSSVPDNAVNPPISKWSDDSEMLNGVNEARERQAKSQSSSKISSLVLEDDENDRSSISDSDLDIDDVHKAWTSTPDPKRTLADDEREQSGLKSLRLLGNLDPNTPNNAGKRSTITPATFTPPKRVNKINSKESHNYYNEQDPNSKENKENKENNDMIKAERRRTAMELLEGKRSSGDRPSSIISTSSPLSTPVRNKRISRLGYKNHGSNNVYVHSSPAGKANLHTEKNLRL